MEQSLIRKIQMREWFAQIAVPEVDGVVDVALGSYPARQGETVWAMEQARRLAPDGCWVEAVWFKG
jgi:hypothetical protein